ncbi:MAG: trigger factor [Gammaproteobacteria bacterium]|nr:trigger factor [Gammaproteobacteria bacterium]
MQVSVETTSGLERRMTVQIPKERIDVEVQNRLVSLKGKANISGFRPGKVPMSEIKRRYGGQVTQEVTGEVMQSSFYEAINQEKLRPAGVPQIQPKATDEQASDVEFTATFEIYPDITVQGIEQIKLDQPKVEIAESEIDQMLETIRKQHKVWHSVERTAQNGDRVLIDFKGKLDGEVFDGGVSEQYMLELGAKRMVAGFEEQIAGMSASEERSISVEFPEDYHSKELAGKTAEFEIKVHKVEEATLPEVDEKFLEIFNIKEGGVSAFREQIKQNMQREAEQRIRTQIKQQVLDGVVEQNPIELPKALIEGEIEALMKQQHEKMVSSANAQSLDVDPTAFEDQARRRVSLGLILTEIIKQNDIKVEAANLRKTIENIAVTYEKPEEIVKYYYSDKQRLAEIEHIVLEDQAVDWIVSKAQVADKNVSFNELMNPAPA